MFLRPLPVLLFLFSCDFLFAQNKHVDLNEFGLNGPVKSVVTLKYDSAGFDSTEKIRKSAEWKFKNEYYFNLSGNLDSLIWTGHFPLTDSPYYTKRVFEYTDGIRTAHDFNASRTLTDSLVYVWENDSTYIITQYKIGENEKIISRHSLSSSLRDKTGITKIFEADSLVLDEFYENVVDKNNRTVATHTHNIITGERTTIEYEHLSLDDHRNARWIIQSNKDSGETEFILRRKIDYY
jgi:hypothetical protein